MKINCKLLVLKLILFIFSFSAFSVESEQTWVNTEYLYWWVQNSPVSVPLITENNNPLAFSFINEPGTNIIFGAGSNRNAFKFGAINGARVTLGTWFGNSKQYGIEASVFDLLSVQNSFTASSLPGNFPVINIPFNSGNENVLVNKETPNSVFVRDTFHSYGYEINGLAAQNLRRSLN